MAVYNKNVQFNVIIQMVNKNKTHSILRFMFCLTISTYVFWLYCSTLVTQLAITKS